MLLRSFLSCWRRRSAAASTAAAAALFTVALFAVAAIWSSSNNNSSNSQPREKIVFLKTHKCASSTIQNILLRRALSHSLVLAAPLTGNYVSRYRPFHRSVLWGTPWEAARIEYNLFCMHTIFNYPEVAHVMGEGGGPVVYFSILRDPAELFVSLWDYAGFSRMFGVSLEEYIFKDKNFFTSPYRDRSKVSNLGRNQMLFDFGLSPARFDDPVAVAKKIREIDQQFHLILIADRFDESMILLKDLLRWDVKDVTYLKSNVQLSSKRSSVSEDALAKLREWLSADYALYGHFARVFQEKVDAFGADRMLSEVRSLRGANEELVSACGFQAVDSAVLDKEFRPWGTSIAGYKLSAGASAGAESASTCRSYALSEMAMLDSVRAAQAEAAREALREQNRSFVGYEVGDFGGLDFSNLKGDPEEVKRALDRVVKGGRREGKGRKV